MLAEEKNNSVVLSGVKDFDLTQTFTCGQCFRWMPANGGYTGVAFGRPLHISQDGGTVTLHNTTLSEYNSLWRGYFHLDYDYGAVKKTLSADPILEKAADFGGGIRLLAQDVWECIVSFIISANNNIPRIQKIIGALCREFGSPVEYNGQIYYTFPSAQTLARLSREDLAVIRAGFRDKYILDAANKAASGELPIDALGDMSTDEARNALMTVSGIGKKVADCILLFSLGRYEVFPIDVWVRRTMERLYIGHEAEAGEIAAFADSHFGALAGFAQQYLFYYEREQTKEKK